MIGNCRDDSAGCTGGQICGASESHTCGRCTSDAHCNNDPRYRGFFCIDGACKMGDCRTSAECTGLREGLLCNAQMPNLCGTCTSDAQCKQEDRYRQRICKTAAGQADSGRCVSDACPTNGQACAANAADFCCGNRCVPGNCCDESQCMAGQACVANSCTTCDAVAGNQYFVDPVNGSDRAGTGSGRAMGAALARCAFRTVAQALSAIPAERPGRHHHHHRGRDRLQHRPVRGRPGRRRPHRHPAHRHPGQHQGDDRRWPHPAAPGRRPGRLPPAGQRRHAGPRPALPLEIDGRTTSRAAPCWSPAATTTVENLLIHETGDHGIRVTDGIAAIGGGVIVRSAGTRGRATQRLEVTGGVARITVPAGSAQTLFEANSGPGITVGPAAEFDATGVATITPGERQRDHRRSDRTGAGPLRRRRSASSRPAASTRVHDLRGIVVWAHTQGPGLLIRGGARVKLRNSVLLANKTNGVLVSPGTDPAASNNLSRIDLGVAGDFGRNHLQAAGHRHTPTAAPACASNGSCPPRP